MKIAYISTIQVPSDKANSIQVMKMSQAMTQLGHEVTLILPGENQAQAEEKDWHKLYEHYGLQTCFEIRYLPLSEKWERRLFDIQAVRLARAINADLIYARSTPPAVTGLLFHHSVILEMHQLPSGNFGPLWFKLFLKLNGHKRLVMITHALKSQLSKAYAMQLPSASQIVAPSGVDLERFEGLPDPKSARKALGLKEDFTAVCTGHLYPGRGMQIFLDLAKAIPVVQFLWIGGREEDTALWQKKALEAGTPNAGFLGFRPNQSIPLYQAAADVLMIPYDKKIGSSGGGDISEVSSPMKVFEYLASGRPIISSDLPVLREILNDKNAVLCSPADLIAWKSAILQFMTNKHLWQKLSAQSKMDARNYAWVDRCRKILASF